MYIKNHCEAKAFSFRSHRENNKQSMKVIPGLHKTMVTIKHLIFLCQDKGNMSETVASGQKSQGSTRQVHNQYQYFNAVYKK